MKEYLGIGGDRKKGQQGKDKRPPNNLGRAEKDVDIA